MKLAAAAFALISALPMAHAAEREEEIKKGLADAVERYANAVSCPGVRVRAADVVALVPFRRDERTPSKYAVLWTGDPGCFAGDGMNATYIAIATVSGGRFIVDPRVSSPVISFDSPVRFVRRVLAFTADSLTLQGNIYGPQDAHNKPTVPVRFTLAADPAGNWRLIEKRELPTGTAGG